jgi:GH35 family endo-1,4-beta-xylanase
MSIRTTGAAKGDVWNLYTNGHLAEFIRFSEGGDYSIVIFAKGSVARDIWPVMTVTLDGEPVGSVNVASRELKSYAFRCQASPGVRKLAVMFSNDYFAIGSDRNLYINKIVLKAIGGQADPTRSNRAEWCAVQAAEESAVLAEARASIERERKADGTVVVNDTEGRPVRGATVMIEQQSHDVLFGCNVFSFEDFDKHDRRRQGVAPEPTAEGDTYRRRFAELFNYATLPFYWRLYEPKRGHTAYAYTDRAVAWCRSEGIQMKGHPILWGHEAGRPSWVRDQPSPALQRERITQLLDLYGNDIGFWEVVNEPAHFPEPVIDDPYRWARQMAPEAHLILNDYGVIGQGFPAFFKLVKEASARGVPFDGIGMQAHEPRTMRFPLAGVRRTLRRYAALGKELHITELMLPSAGEKILGSHQTGTWDEAAQADYAVKFYTVCFAEPSLRAISWWDLCDRTAYAKGTGLLRKDLTPKPAYNALRALIHEEWRTVIRMRTDARGEAAFRGFCGTYRVSVERGGRTSRQTFRHAGGESNRHKLVIEEVQHLP